MPPISELVNAPQEGRYQHTQPLPGPQHTNLPAEFMRPDFNVVLRCPMPAIGTVNPDSLRQFYRAGLNQMRVLTGK